MAAANRLLHRGSGAKAEEGLRHPRLTAEMRRLAALSPTTEDWRKYPPSEIAAKYALAAADPAGRSLVSTAIFVGTKQAIMQGSYWAPAFALPGASKVDCRHHARPVSALYRAEKKLPQAAPKARAAAPQSIACEECNLLDACTRLLASPQIAHVVMLHCTSTRDPRNETSRHTHCREDQLFLRTTYCDAFERMESDIQAPLGDAIDQGGIIYTSHIGIMRGAIEEGAPFLRNPPQVDVMWMGLNPRPQLGEQESYAKDDEKAEVARLLDRAFALAAARGADAIVVPPLGCGGMHGCQHPRLDVADLIHETAKRYASVISHVCVASDQPAHFDPNWWTDFAAAAKGGRAPWTPYVAVPPIKLPPYLRVKKDEKVLLDKTRRLDSGRRAPPARDFRGSLASARGLSTSWTLGSGLQPMALKGS